MLAATRERARATASQNNTYCTYCRMCTYCRVACCIVVVFGHMCAHQSLIYQDGLVFHCSLLQWRLYRYIMDGIAS